MTVHTTPGERIRAGNMALENAEIFAFVYICVLLSKSLFTITTNFRYDNRKF